MSSCFNGDWHGCQLRWTVGLLALLACGTARAQGVAGGEPVLSSIEDRAYTGTTPLRIGHATEGYGQEASETAVGGRVAVDLADAIGFLDGQFRISNESRGGANLGLGYRWMTDGFLTGDPRILGVSGWYDGQETVNENYFNQLGVSLESLGEFIDLRLNGNFPLEDEKLGDQVLLTDSLAYFGNSIGQQTITPQDVSLRVVDAEAAARVFDLNLWVYGGAYQMDGNGISETGAKGGVRGYLTNDLLLGVTVTDDQEFGTNTIFQVIWTPGRVSAGPSSWIHNLADRMREHVYRNSYVATQQEVVTGAIALTDADGNPLRVVHVNSNATAPGDGSFENPLTSLDSINGASQVGDIILAHAGSEFADQTAVLKEEQRLLGEGAGNTHTVVTSERGTVTLPETFAGASSAARPIITAPAAGSGVVLAGATTDNADFDAIEVSNFEFDGGQTAIFSSAAGAVNINRLMVHDLTGDAINLTALTETLANSTERVRFTPTIDDVVFDNVGGNDILLNSGAEATSVATLETITISDVTSTDGGDVGIELQNTRRNATLSNIRWTGDAASEGAIRVQNAGTQASVVLNGTNTITGGDTTDADNSGFAISLENNAGSMTVTGTTITNTGGDSIVINDGAMNLTFTGRIEQTVNNASVVSVLGEHTGTVNFNELTSGGGVINATTGDGLQFADADGVYRFNHLVTLNGAAVGVDVTDDSEGTFLLTNAAITNTADAAVNINGSNVNTFTISGTITSSGTGRPATIQNNTGGDIAINSAITGTGQGILVADNTDTNVVFAGATTLTTTTNTAVDVNDHTGGTVAFTNSANAITTTTGVGLSMNNANVATAGVNFRSVSVNGAANGIALSGVTGGIVTVTGQGTTDDSGGTIAATGDAILITNVERVSINNMNLSTSASTQPGASAVNFNVDNATQSRLALNNNNISLTAAAAGDAVLLNIGNNASQADIRVTSNVVSNAAGDEALRLQTAATAQLKTVNVLVQNNTFTSDSAAATDAAANFQVDGGAVLNATVNNNTFTNNGAGRGFEMATVNAASEVHLALDNNTASGTDADYRLVEAVGSDFFIEDVANVQTRNTGTETFVPAFGDFTEQPGTSVPQPSAP